MSKTLVIVESPTKARTIEKFLGKEYDVTASYGHIRDLPNNASEIPESIKKEKWSRLGVHVEKDFEPLYVIPSEKKKRVQELKKLLKEADLLLLATDEDREGESISWHLLDVLKPKCETKRLVFHEITKSAIQKAIDSPRDIDESMVQAQETRRVIDRLFGYLVSPLLWKKMMPGLSAGRVQSVAMRLLVERERERIAFRRAKYWDLSAVFAKQEGSKQSFEAELVSLAGKRIASGKDFEPTTGKLTDPDKVTLLDDKSSVELRERLLTQQPVIHKVEEKPYSSKPYPPFTTSTLQQEASRKLSFAAKRTMSVAQTLYENGFITYMRTDSTSMSEEGVNAARNLIQRDFGKEFLPDAPRVYKTKVRNAQEAHEAVRPAGEEFASPEDVRKKLGPEAFRLYELIWKRTLACQMKDAQGKRVGVQIAVDDAVFRASGKTIEFPGYLRAYVEGSDDPDAELADQEKILPKLTEGEQVSAKEMEVKEHETQPPARYTEGSLIKQLEKLGIGRPSTWATIVGVVLNRKYAFKKGTALVPTYLAVGLTGLMERYFTHLLDYKFTAGLEDDLDAISRGEVDRLSYLKKFYSGNGYRGLKDLVDEGEEKIDPREINGIPLGTLQDGTEVEVRVGRYGPFISDGENRASVPDMTAPDELTIEKAQELLETAAKGPQSLGEHPETGEPVYLKTGRFGPYIQQGDGEDGEKPKMASLLPNMTPEEVDFDMAVKLLSLPRTLGKHPESGEEIVAANGRYGPYIKAGSETRTIPMDDMSPIDMTFEQAIELLKQPKRRGRASTPKVMKELGKHPVSEKELSIRSGRYGPYVTDGEINASVPKGMDPAEVSIEDAVGLLEARLAKLEAQGKAPSQKAAKKKKSAAKKKSSSKKSSTKKKSSSAKKSSSSKKSSTKKSSAKKSSAKKKSSSKSKSSDPAPAA